MRKPRNPNRPIVLALHDAAALHRWLEFREEGRLFDNPIIALESKQAADEARLRLGEKLLAIYQAHSGASAARAASQEEDR
jgi:hypothetical protein